MTINNTQTCVYTHGEDAARNPREQHTHTHTHINTHTHTHTHTHTNIHTHTHTHVKIATLSEGGGTPKV